MTRYVLAMYHPSETPPPPEVLEPMVAGLGKLREEMQAEGSWVFAGGLHPPSATTVVRKQGDEVLVTDGPYLEGKEFIGGFTIVDVPDLDVALRWARRTAEVTGLPIEVRPFQG